MKTPGIIEHVLNTPVSWYLHNGKVNAVLIGPAGFDNEEWNELEPVATPAGRWGNPFYMEAECACVLARHGLTTVFDNHNNAPHTVNYADINYAVPDVTTDQPFDYEYIRAFEAFRRNWIKQHQKSK